MSAALHLNETVLSIQEDAVAKEQKYLKQKHAIHVDALKMIARICKSKKHKDQILDILCEVNRVRRLERELCQKNTK